jgi:hypothetical protein
MSSLVTIFTKKTVLQSKKNSFIICEVYIAVNSLTHACESQHRDASSVMNAPTNYQLFDGGSFISTQPAISTTLLSDSGEQREKPER